MGSKDLREVIGPWFAANGVVISSIRTPGRRAGHHVHIATLINRSQNMRTSLFILAGVLTLAACDDAAESTAPRSRSVVTPAANVSTMQAADLPPGPTASAKPSAGFTAITSVDSPMGLFGGVLNGMWPVTGTVTATCPAGSKVIAGGHNIFGSHPQDLRINVSKPDGANGWMMTVENVGASASQSRIIVTAICVS